MQEKARDTDLPKLLQRGVKHFGSHCASWENNRFQEDSLLYFSGMFSSFSMVNNRLRRFDATRNETDVGQIGASRCG